jgi:hypothetical protein
MIGRHYINSLILDIIATERKEAALDSFIVKICRESTAIRRRIRNNCKDRESSRSFPTMG